MAVAATTAMARRLRCRQRRVGVDSTRGPAPKTAGVGGIFAESFTSVASLFLKAARTRGN